MYETALRHYQEGRLADAVTACRALLNRQPRDFKALHLLGLVRNSQGALDEAAFFLTAALGTAPTDPADEVIALNDLGTVLLAQKQFDAAFDCYRRAQTIRADDAMTLYNYGNALYAAQRYVDAIVVYRQCLTVQPDFPALHNNLGNALRSAGQVEAAVNSYRRAIALQPDFPAAIGNLGRALCQLDRAEEAVSYHRAAVIKHPSDADALIDLANTLVTLRQYAEAEQQYRRALQLRPDDAAALVGLATALSARNQHPAAIACLDRVLALHPDHGDALIALGNALVGLNRHEAALDQYRAAEALLPDSARLRLLQGVALLAVGAWREGWRRLEARFLMRRLFPPDPMPTDVPHWRGETDLAGKTILLHAEQGLGDTLQFVRYVPLAAARGARVVLRVQPLLHKLLTGMPGADSVITFRDYPPAVDLLCPLMSLPLAFGTEVATVPASVPYLQASPEKLAEWQGRLGPHMRPRIGLMWWGRQHLPHRSLPLQSLAPLLQVPGLEFHTLQKEMRPEDREVLVPHPFAVDHSAALQDFTDTAALASQMDLVVSIDTSVAHLAGALGLPIWLLLPFSADCRWLRERDDTPWYPTMRLFRQRQPGDWESVVKAVVQALGERAW